MDQGALLGLLVEVGALRGRLVFTGGAVLPLYWERPSPFRVRPTKDADAVVACTRYLDYVALQAEFRRMGFRDLAEEAAPICRLRSPAGYLLDLMPTSPEVLGFGNPWFAAGHAQAMAVALADGTPLRIFPPALYLAAKAEAHASRGLADPWMSHDLEDIATLIACRPSLVGEVALAEPALQAHVAAFAAEALAIPDVEELLEGHVGALAPGVLLALQGWAGQA